MKDNPDRRVALLRFGVAAGAAALGSNAAKAANTSDAWMPQGARTLKALHGKLNAAPGRRNCCGDIFRYGDVFRREGRTLD